MDNWTDVVLPEDGKLADLVLLRGNHMSREEGVCIMEAVAWLAGEKHSDAPKCACPVISAFMVRTNDNATDEQRQELRQFIPALVKSKASKAVMAKRGFLAADYAVRMFAPAALDYFKHGEDAALLRGVMPITDKATAIAARDVTREVRERAAAYAAAYAAADAYAAAYAAADADAAAYAAADAAAAAYAAADAAAAAYAAADADAAAAAAADAYAAAYAAAAALKTALWPHRLDLIRAMLAVTE